jgi:hypothetical protein
MTAEVYGEWRFDDGEENRIYLPMVPFQTGAGRQGLVLEPAGASRQEFHRIGLVRFDADPETLVRVKWNRHIIDQEWKDIALGDENLAADFRYYELKRPQYCAEAGGMQTLYTIKIV